MERERPTLSERSGGANRLGLRFEKQARGVGYRSTSDVLGPFRFSQSGVALRFPSQSRSGGGLSGCGGKKRGGMTLP